MIFHYYMTRYSTSLLYTAEFLFDILFLAMVLILYVRGLDKKSLWVYIIFGLLHSVMELIAEGTGTRVIKDAMIFSIPVGYPFLPFVLGFFEGGFICLGAYHFTRAILNKDKLSMKFSLILFVIPFTMILLYFARNQRILNLPLAFISKQY